MLGRRRRDAARPSTTCCSPVRPGSARRRLAGIVAAELEVGAADHERSRARARRRPRGDPHEPRRRRRALHRRDPPPAAAGRRGALPGDGGLPARHRDRQGSVGALDPARPAALHARRRDDAQRHDHRAAARPVRLRRAPRLLRARRPRHDPRALRPTSSGCRSTPTARPRSPRRARGTPRIANRLLEAGARLRRGARRRHGRRRDRRTPRSRSSRSTSSGSTRSTGRSSRALCETFARPAGRPRHAGGRGGRGARDRRGRVRAVPAQAGAAAAHAPRAGSRPPAAYRAPRARGPDRCRAPRACSANSRGAPPGDRCP